MGRSDHLTELNKADALKWGEFRKIQAAKRKDLEKQVDEAVETAEIITTPVEIVPKNKRRGAYNTWKRKPINGYSEHHSDIARHVMSLKMGGEPAKEAFQAAALKFDHKPRYIENLYYTKRELFDLAEGEVMESAIKEYHQNLWICRTALSQAGPLAVQTFIDAMNSDNATWNVKTKAAHAVLKLIDVDGSSNANPSEKVALASLGLVKDALAGRGNGEKSHVIDVEDAEIIEENASESGTDG